MRIRFEADALEVVLGNGGKETENAFVGGENRWRYDTFTNWEFWWPNFPVLVYFKARSGVLAFWRGFGQILDQARIMIMHVSHCHCCPRHNDTLVIAGARSWS